MRLDPDGLRGCAGGGTGLTEDEAVLLIVLRLDLDSRFTPLQFDRLHGLPLLARFHLHPSLLSPMSHVLITLRVVALSRCSQGHGAPLTLPL